MTCKEAREILGLSKRQFAKYFAETGLAAIAPSQRRGGCVTYDLSEEHLDIIRRARAEAHQRHRQIRVEQCAEMRERAGPEHLAELARRKRLNAIRRQDKDYYGELVAFVFMPAAVEDDEVSSRLPGGPMMATMQYRPFYPRLYEHSLWAKANTWRPRSLDSRDDGDDNRESRYLDRYAVEVWYAHNRG